MEAVPCRAQVSVSRGPPMGFGATPARGESRDLPAAVASLLPRIAFATKPGAAPVRPGRRPHPPAQSHHRPADRHLVVYRIRSGPVPAGDSFQYQGCRSSTIPSRACPDTSSMMSSMRCEQCVELVALSVLCVQRPGERRGRQSCLGIFVPPSHPGVRFVPRFGWGSYGASQNQKPT